MGAVTEVTVAELGGRIRSFEVTTASGARFTVYRSVNGEGIDCWRIIDDPGLLDAVEHNPPGRRPRPSLRPGEWWWESAEDAAAAGTAIVEAIAAHQVAVQAATAAMYDAVQTLQPPQCQPPTNTIDTHTTN